MKDSESNTTSTTKVKRIAVKAAPTRKRSTARKPVDKLKHKILFEVRFGQFSFVLLFVRHGKEKA